MTVFVLALIILVVFVAGWFYVPKGLLTKITSTVLLTLTAGYEFLSEQWYLLSGLVPPDYGPWFIVGFLVLTVAATARPGRGR